MGEKDGRGDIPGYPFYTFISDRGCSNRRVSSTN